MKGSTCGDHAPKEPLPRYWRGRPQVSCQVIVELIAATTTRAGLKIRSRIDDNECPLGVKVSDEQMKALNIRRDGFHDEWNYILINSFRIVAIWRRNSKPEPGSFE